MNLKKHLIGNYIQLVLLAILLALTGVVTAITFQDQRTFGGPSLHTRYDIESTNSRSSKNTGRYIAETSWKVLSC